MILLIPFRLQRELLNKIPGHCSSVKQRSFLKEHSCIFVREVTNIVDFQHLLVATAPMALPKLKEGKRPNRNRASGQSFIQFVAEK